MRVVLTGFETWEQVGNNKRLTSSKTNQNRVQEERRRINNIDNRTYLDTVEVIGSIPVAPTLFLNQLHSSRFGQLLYFHTDFHTQLV